MRTMSTSLVLHLTRCRVVCNPGSVGVPLDGAPRPSWVLLEGEPGRKCILLIRRVEYDIDRAIQMIDAVDYLGFQGSKRQNTYKKMIQTGTHWRVDEKKRVDTQPSGSMYSCPMQAGYWPGKELYGVRRHAADSGGRSLG